MYKIIIYNYIVIMATNINYLCKDNTKCKYSLRKLQKKSNKNKNWNYNEYCFSIYIYKYKWWGGLSWTSSKSEWLCICIGNYWQEKMKMKIRALVYALICNEIDRSMANKTNTISWFLCCWADRRVSRVRFGPSRRHIVPASSWLKT